MVDTVHLNLSLKNFYLKSMKPRKEVVQCKWKLLREYFVGAQSFKKDLKEYVRTTRLGTTNWLDS